MPELTRRRANEQPESWNIHYDGVCVGNISHRSGIPQGVPGWQWSCGFHCDNARPREGKHGIADSFEVAREAFEAAWRDYLPLRTPEDFAEVRHRNAWTAEKYARLDRGEPAPPWPLPGWTDAAG